LPSETEAHRGGGGEGKSQGVKSSVPRVLAARPPASLRPSGNSGGGGSEVVGGSGSGNGSGVGNGNGSGSGGKLKKVKPVAPAKVVVKVVTQARTFRCLAAPTDTWAHVCALVQVFMIQCHVGGIHCACVCVCAYVCVRVRVCIRVCVCVCHLVLC